MTPVQGGAGRAWLAARAVRAPLAAGLAVLAGAAYLGVSDPYRPGGHLVCPVYALTGFFCAGCGGQRAVHELVTGDPAAAWGMNPLVVLIAPIAVLAWWRWLDRSRQGGAPRAPARAARHGGAGTWGPWLALAVVVGFAVLRNVPALAPWLAP